MKQPFKVGNIVEILPCPYAETFDIVGKTAKVIQLLSFSNIVAKIKVEIGDNFFYLPPMELKKIKGDKK